MLLYNNPAVACSIERDAQYDAAPAVIATLADGSERVFDLRAMAAETPGRVDREVFKLLGAAESVAFDRDVSYGDGSTSLKSRRDKRVREKAVKPDAAATEGSSSVEGAATGAPAAEAATVPPTSAASGGSAAGGGTGGASGASRGGRAAGKGGKKIGD